MLYSFWSFESISSLGIWKCFPKCEHEQNTEQGNEATSRLTSFVQYKCFYITADA